MSLRSDDLLAVAREQRFLTPAAGFAVGYAFVAFIGALVNAVWTKIDDEPGYWSFVLTTFVALVVIAVLALAALVWSRDGGRRSR